ncbi:fumarylpyruvate hydrolase [Rhodovulum bhavnagarense]|uniref:Fumarylpyruvate hydrolase n=1 Tax=Rhodovulum bhavnagarense TaxID=992286 RepID=A0A4R2RS71_9RHOB|nr:fumarylacetoacetate hydrolase family protein [Rhodovulum bhavnagarense]TCP62741.1 fumarylpyruvate hydrolase [Rhodovulum bhavnagarense]
MLPPPARASLRIADSNERFAVRRIFCVGRNYADHIREMGNDTREPPFFFTKPADALVGEGMTIPYPRATTNLHHEAELVAAIGLGGTDIAPETALSHVWGYAPGNDLTRRDLQDAAKSARRPWDMAKAFDNSAICGALHPVARIGHPSQARLTCKVNGVLRQDADIADMIWPLPQIIAHLSRMVALAPGDLVYTGTPGGVGPLCPGDHCTVTIAGLGEVNTTIS